MVDCTRPSAATGNASRQKLQITTITYRQTGTDNGNFHNNLCAFSFDLTAEVGAPKSKDAELIQCVITFKTQPI